MTQDILTNSIQFLQMHILYTLPVKGLGKIFFKFFEKSLMLAKASTVLAKYSQNSKIVKCFYN